jgi:hypothetical protein
VLLGTPLQASLSPHLLNVPVQIANKLGLQKKKKKMHAAAAAAAAVVGLIPNTFRKYQQNVPRKIILNRFFMWVLNIV